MAVLWRNCHYCTVGDRNECLSPAPCRGVVIHLLLLRLAHHGCSAFQRKWWIPMKTVKIPVPSTTSSVWISVWNTRWPCKRNAIVLSGGAWPSSTVMERWMLVFAMVPYSRVWGIRIRRNNNVHCSKSRDILILRSVLDDKGFAANRRNLLSYLTAVWGIPT